MKRAPDPTPDWRDRFNDLAGRWGLRTLEERQLERACARLGKRIEAAFAEFARASKRFGDRLRQLMRERGQ
jgi:hypothetical protein